MAARGSNTHTPQLWVSRATLSSIFLVSFLCPPREGHLSRNNWLLRLVVSELDRDNSKYDRSMGERTARKKRSHHQRLWIAVCLPATTILYPNSIRRVSPGKGTTRSDERLGGSIECLLLSLVSSLFSLVNTRQSIDAVRMNEQKYIGMVAKFKRDDNCRILH